MSLFEGFSPFLMAGLACGAGGLLLVLALAVAILRQSRRQQPEPGGLDVSLEDSLPAGLQARLLPELAAGRKIEVIKLVRELTGLSLHQAKALVEQIQSRMPDRPEPSTPSVVDREQLAAQLQTRSQHSSRLELIKWVRQQTGWGPKQAKAYVEQRLDG